MKVYLASAVAIALVGLVPVGSSDDEPFDPWAAAMCATPHEVGDAVETIPWPTAEDPGMTLTIHALCWSDLNVNLDTDCTSNAYSLTGWDWATAYNAKVDTTNSYGFTSSQVVSTFATSAETWDSQVGANIFGTFTSGGNRNQIPLLNGINQHGWKSLGGGGTIAVTYTWRYSNWDAAESDAAYNTFYPWSLTGQAGKMDLQNIATHELGHTFGMGHSSTAAQNSCLTMYPSGTYGETQKRTLGDGDITGINVVY